jgi:hypothetical protein
MCRAGEDWMRRRSQKTGCRANGVGERTRRKIAVESGFGEVSGSLKSRVLKSRGRLRKRVYS